MGLDMRFCLDFRRPRWGVQERVGRDGRAETGVVLTKAGCPELPQATHVVRGK